VAQFFTHSVDAYCQQRVNHVVYRLVILLFCLLAGWLLRLVTEARTVLEFLMINFLANRTNGRLYDTVWRLSVVSLSGMYCG